VAFLDVTTKELTFLRPGQKWDAGELSLSEDGKRLAYVLNEDGFSRLVVTDTETKQDMTVPAVPCGVISGLRWHHSGRNLGFSLSAARQPSDVYSIDVEKGTLDRWTESETGGLNAQTFSEPELIHWKSFDGRMISGFLYLPSKRFAGPRPVIVNIHGGPEGQSLPSFIGRNNYYISELGVAMIYPNVRGSSGYGKTFLALDNGLKREDSVKDIGALLDWIAGDPRMDAKRILVTGGSYGGYMTLASAFHFNDRLCCTVDVVGISNFVSFFERTSPYRRDLRRVEYGDERDPKIREFFEKIAPLNHASEISKPMFIVAGRNDPRVPAHEGEQMAAAIRKNGAPVWYLIADDEGHGFAKRKNQDYQFAATVMFVKEFLLK
jgi:dipeptidyl aminopeptidase/acylaminoacyl peptidase